jgi:hypothetical protein
MSASRAVHYTTNVERQLGAEEHNRNILTTFRCRERMPHCVCEVHHIWIGILSHRLTESWNDNSKPVDLEIQIDPLAIGAFGCRRKEFEGKASGELEGNISFRSDCVLNRTREDDKAIGTLGLDFRPAKQPKKYGEICSASKHCFAT